MRGAASTAQDMSIVCAPHALRRLSPRLGSLACATSPYGRALRWLGMLLTRQRLDLVGAARMPSGGSEGFADAPGRIHGTLPCSIPLRARRAGVRRSLDHRAGAHQAGDLRQSAPTVAVERLFELMRDGDLRRAVVRVVERSFLHTSCEEDESQLCALSYVVRRASNCTSQQRLLARVTELPIARRREAAR
jgi:hypothetical protein